MEQEQQQVDYEKAISWLRDQGKRLYGGHFELLAEDLPLIRKLLSYFLRDQVKAAQYGLNLSKGILLAGPVGCGKTALMSLLRLFEVKDRFIIKSCRELSFEFFKDGYMTIQKYSSNSFRSFQPLVYCFDDLGAESSLKHYGNECNVMAEVLLSRHDQFISRKLITHLTTNLSSSEIETLYGTRVRSRMREMFNQLAYPKNSIDKR